MTAHSMTIDVPFTEPRDRRAYLDGFRNGKDDREHNRQPGTLLSTSGEDENPVKYATRLSEIYWNAYKKGWDSNGD